MEREYRLKALLLSIMVVIGTMAVIAVGLIYFNVMVTEVEPIEKVPLHVYVSDSVDEEWAERVKQFLLRQYDVILHRFERITVTELNEQELDDGILIGTCADVTHVTSEHIVTEMGEVMGNTYMQNIDEEGHSFLEQCGGKESVHALTPFAFYESVPEFTEVADMYGLYFNYDIFDQFGVAYPENDMTWQDAYERAVSLTHTTGETDYYGMDIDIGLLLDLNELQLPMITPYAGQSVLSRIPEWEKWFDTKMRFYRIAGNELTMERMYAGRNLFLEEQTLAMYVDFRLDQTIESRGEQLGGDHVAHLNWGRVSVPHFDAQPANNLMPEFDPQTEPLFMVIGAPGPADMFQDVLAALVMERLNTGGDNEISIVENMFYAVARGEMEIGDALRHAEEEINIAVHEELMKPGNIREIVPLKEGD